MVIRDWRYQEGESAISTIIIITPPPKVKSNLSTEETIARLRDAADALESGQLTAEPVEETE